MWPVISKCQSAWRPQFSCSCGSESRMRKLHLHCRDFVQANSKMADRTAGQLESALHVNKASAKAFELRTSWSNRVLGSLNWFPRSHLSQELKDYWHYMYLPWLSVWANFTIFRTRTKAPAITPKLGLWVHYLSPPQHLLFKWACRSPD